MHYKIVTRIHVTNTLLHRIGIADSDECVNCHDARDTLVHKYWRCPMVRNFWDDIKLWLLESNIITNGDQLSEVNVLLGTANDNLTNHVIMCAKEIIRRGKGLHLYHLLQCLEQDNVTEHYIANINGTGGLYQKKLEHYPSDIALSGQVEYR